MDDAEAADVLAGAAREVSSGDRLIIRLWHFPPGQTWSTWILIQRALSDGLLREVRLSPEGALSTRERLIGDDEIRAFRTPAEFVSLDPEEIVTELAATEFGLEGFPTSGGPAVARWDSPVPPSPQNIAAWHSRTRARFLSLLEAKR